VDDISYDEESVCSNKLFFDDKNDVRRNLIDLDYILSMVTFKSSNSEIMFMRESKKLRIIRLF